MTLNKATHRMNLGTDVYYAHDELNNLYLSYKTS
jgi:hypothetical protein